MVPVLATYYSDYAPVLATAADAERLFRRSLDRGDIEQAQIAFLDADRRVIAMARIVGHACDAVPLPIRAVLIRALTVQAAALIVAHNHPCGDPTPSAADLAATRALAAAAGLLGLRLIDHLVFGDDECRSFRQSGLL